jgi:hypothetical protein
MPAAKVTGGGSKSTPAPAVKAQKAEEKITPKVADNKVKAAQAVALKATKADDKKAVNDAKVAAGKVVGSKPVTVTPTPNPTPQPQPHTKVVGNGSNKGNTITDDSFDESNPAMDQIPPPTDTRTDEVVIVKTPTRNVTDISSLVPKSDAGYIQKILFENLSAIELSIIERHDTIEGIDQKYSIISNLSEIRKKYDMAKQLTIMDKFKPLTSIYTINIQDKIPQEDYLTLQDLYSTYEYFNENNGKDTREKGYYYIDSNGDLVIDLINIEKNQQVEVLIDTNGTIYKIEKVEL